MENIVKPRKTVGLGYDPNVIQFTQANVGRGSILALHFVFPGRIGFFLSTEQEAFAAFLLRRNQRVAGALPGEQQSIGLARDLSRMFSV